MTEAVSLDNPQTYSRLDPDDMYRRLGELPQQIEDSWRLAGELDLPNDYRSVRSVVIAGMGGSAIGGSLLESYGAAQIPVPLQVWRNYGVPGYVDSSTLVIAISYSGGTEETLSAFEAARARGAKLLAITTGGRLEELANQAKVPYLTFHYNAQPRATIGYLFTPLLRIFERLDFLPGQDQAIREALQVVREVSREYAGDMPSPENPAKQAALAIQRKAAVIYGADYLAAVARRWKTQMNENAKNWAFYEELPELDHNAVVGYENPKGLGAAVQIIMLYGSNLPERIRLRMDVTQQLLSGFGVEWRLAEAQGDGTLAQMYSLIAMGDYASYYLALLNNADPSSIAPIQFLKQALAREERIEGVPPVTSP